MKNFIFNYSIKQAEILNNEDWKKVYNYNVYMGDGENLLKGVIK